MCYCWSLTEGIPLLDTGACEGLREGRPGELSLLPSGCHTTFVNTYVHLDFFFIQCAHDKMALVSRAGLSLPQPVFHILVLSKSMTQTHDCTLSVPSVSYVIKINNHGPLGP